MPYMNQAMSVTFLPLHNTPFVHTPLLSRDGQHSSRILDQCPDRTAKLSDMVSKGMYLRKRVELRSGSN